MRRALSARPRHHGCGRRGNEGGGLQYVPQPHPDVLSYVVLHLRAQEQQQQFLGQLWGFRHWSRFQSQARDGPEVCTTAYGLAEYSLARYSLPSIAGIKGSAKLKLYKKNYLYIYLYNIIHIYII